MEIAGSKSKVNFVLLLLLIIIIFSGFTYIVYSFDTNNIKFNEYSMDLVIAPNNSYTIVNTSSINFAINVPRTHVVSLSSSQTFEIGVVFLDPSIFLENIIDQNGDLNENFDTYDKALEQGAFLTFEDQVRGHETYSISIDFQINQENYTLIIYYLDLTNNLSAELGYYSTINLEMPFPESFVVIAILFLINISFLFALSFPQTNGESFLSKLNSKIQKYSLDVFIVIILVLNYVSILLYESIFTFFLQSLLLFFALYRTNAMENILGFSFSKGHKIFFASYLTASLLNHALNNNIFNRTVDFRSFLFFIHFGNRLFIVVFGFLLFLLISKIVSTYQLLEGPKDSISKKLIRWTMAISFIYVIDFAIFVFDFISQIFSDFATGGAELLLQIIGVLWALNYLIIGYNWFNQKIKKSKDQIDQDKVSFWQLFKIPDINEVKNGIKSNYSLLIFVYVAYVFMIWSSIIETSIIFINEDLATYESPLDILLFSSWILSNVILRFLVWLVGLRYLQSLALEGDERERKALYYAFIALGIIFALTLMIDSLILYDFLGVYFVFLNPLFGIFGIIYSLRLYRRNLEASFEGYQSKLLWGVFIFLNLVGIEFHPTYGDFNAQLPLLLLIIFGYFIINMTKVTQALVAPEIEIRQNFLLDIIIVAIGFFNTFFVLGLFEGVLFFGFYLLYMFVAYSFLRDREYVLEEFPDMITPKVLDTDYPYVEINYRWKSLIMLVSIFLVLVPAFSIGIGIFGIFPGFGPVSDMTYLYVFFVLYLMVLLYDGMEKSIGLQKNPQEEIMAERSEIVQERSSYTCSNCGTETMSLDQEFCENCEKSFN